MTEVSPIDTDTIVLANSTEEGQLEIVHEDVIPREQPSKDNPVSRNASARTLLTCQICDMKFGRQKELSRHTRDIHKIEPDCPAHVWKPYYIIHAGRGREPPPDCGTRVPQVPVDRRVPEPGGRTFRNRPQTQAQAELCRVRQDVCPEVGAQLTRQRHPPRHPGSKVSGVRLR